MHLPAGPARTLRQRGAGAWFNPHVQQQVLQLHQRDKLNHRQIAERIGCSRHVVSALLHAPPLAPTVGPLTPADVQRYERGQESITDLAARLNCYYVIARRLLINAGATVPVNDDEQLRTEIVRRYTDERQSIRHIAAALRRSYCFVHTSLTAAKVRMRQGGYQSPERPTASPTTSHGDARSRTGTLHHQGRRVT